MSARPDLAGVIDKALREQGLTDDPANYDGDIHSWRCSHPDIYGPCSCFADTVRDLAAALNAAIEAWLADEGTQEAVEVTRGWRTYSDGSQSPVERWVRHADGDWVSLDSSRRTSGDILMDFDAGVNAGPDVPTAQPGSEGADDAPDEAKGLTAPAPASDCLTCGCHWSMHNGWGCADCPCEEVPTAALAALTTPTTTEPEEGR